MSYLDSMLMHDERVIYRTQLHWVLYVNGILITCAGWLMAVIGPDRFFGIVFANPPELLASAYKIIACAIVLCGCWLLLGAFVRQSTTELIVTNCRVLTKFGWLRRETFEIFLSKVAGANIEQTMTGRLLDFGCVHVVATSGLSSPIELIFHPREFQLAIVEQIEVGEQKPVRSHNE